MIKSTQSAHLIALTKSQINPAATIVAHATTNHGG